MKVTSMLTGGGQPSVELTRQEMRYLRAAHRIAGMCRAVMGDTEGNKFVVDSIAAIDRIEAEEMKAEAIKAGADEESRPLLAGATDPGPYCGVEHKGEKAKANRKAGAA